MVKIYLKYNNIIKQTTEIDQSSIIDDYRFISSWILSENSNQITYDINKAKEVIKEEIRKQREEMWRNVDTEWFKAFEESDIEKQRNIAEKKQKMRDAPEHSSIKDALTIEELKKITLNSILESK